MQSMFRLPWSTEPPVCDKVFSHQPRQVPVVDIAMLSKLKRKRSDSADVSLPANAHVQKKCKAARGEVERIIVDKVATAPIAADKPVATAADNRKDSAAVSVSSVAASPVQSAGATAVGNNKSLKLKTNPEPDHSTAMDTEYMTPLQQAIDAQISYEILLKHNELRLIEQELAKAQVALEQLRRCSIIPFPGTEGLHQDVSDGVGPALRPQQGYTEPEHAAPWGVVDGPYTRHLSRWLISDPQFDSVPYASLYHGGAESRSSRAGFTDAARTKSRTSRTSGNASMQYIPDLTPTVPKADPLLHKRSTDGAWVRLYCHTCKHSNFSNTQGFLNHCRIKHQQSFKSHDQAAIACGIEVGSDEAVPSPQVSEAPAAVPSVPATPVVSNPTSTPVATAAPSTTPLATPSLVHPLIRNNAAKPAPSLPPRPVPGPLSTKFNHTARTSANMLVTPNMSPGSKIPDYFSAHNAVPSQNASKASFLPSPQTPYMNAMLSKNGWSGNLGEMVENARAKVELTPMDLGFDAESPMHTAPPSATSEVASHPMARGSSKKGGMAPASQRPLSQKGQPKVVRTPEALDLTATPSLGNSDMHVIPESPAELSPHGIESNPGLVSDHDDDDDEDDAHFAAQLDQDGDFVMDHDVMVEDGSDIDERRKGIDDFRKAGSSKQ